MSQLLLFIVFMAILLPILYLFSNLASSKWMRRPRNQLLLGAPILVVCIACIGYGIWLIVITGDSAGWSWIWRPMVMATILLLGWARFGAS